MGRLALLAANLSLVLCLSAGAARADKVTTKAAADALFREAITLADRGELGASVEKFKASYELDPARGTLQGWAMAEEKLGRLLDAYTRFQRLLEAATAAGDKARASFAKERLEVLRVRVPTLLIELGGDVPRGTKVSVDDDALPAGALGSALPINPGDHLVVAVAPDGRRFSRMVGVSEGARARLRVTWVVQAAEPEPVPMARAQSADHGQPTPTLPVVGLAVGVAGLVAVTAGAYLWFDAGKDFDAVDQSCPDKQCSKSEQDRIDSGRTKETWSQVLLIGGGIAVAGGVTLFVIGSRERSAPGVTAKASPGGLLVSGRF